MQLKCASVRIYALDLCESHVRAGEDRLDKRGILFNGFVYRTDITTTQKYYRFAGHYDLSAVFKRPVP